ncbi:MAG: NAD+ synthase [Phycisphaerae bacterium]|nr:NAD+ synthase [Phycisphaerae bacterium]
MKIALAQINPVVGDITGNSAKIADCLTRAEAAGAELVVFSELVVTGYPPRDLLRKEQFVADSLAAVQDLAVRCTNVAALVGYVRPIPEGTGWPLQNVAALLADGAIRYVHVKSLLPTYDVFDETRYFQPGPTGQWVEFAGCKLGLSICEDLWDAVALGRALYGRDPIAELTAAGAEAIVNMAASPYEMGKAAQREELFARQAARSRCPIVYVNQVGGNDELIFDGASCVVSPAGQVIARAASFREDLLVADLAGGGHIEPLGEEMASLSSALKLGLADYVHKCGFRSVVLGLSGGIDSAVVAVLAAEALGPENVLALAMPSRYSSAASLQDAQAVARAAHIELRVLPIEPLHVAYAQVLRETMPLGSCDGTEENVQARVRGNLIMAHSNKLGHLALATGNKSELSTGYCTLYGDMAGALSPIGDVLKTVVYKLADQLNAEAGRERIPRRVFEKAPSAELKPGQRDQDKLPPYDVLDEILRRYIEQDRTAEQIVAEGFDAATVQGVVQMVDSAEFKRRQASPVLKVTSRAFGSGRRMPIAQGYRPLP